MTRALVGFVAGVGVDVDGEDIVRSYFQSSSRVAELRAELDKVKRRRPSRGFRNTAKIAPPTTYVGAARRRPTALTSGLLRLTSGCYGSVTTL
jgi:hypothetical protein